MYKNMKTKIDNAVMQKRTNENGDVLNYTIAPANGYLLHEKSRDDIVTDEHGNETGEVIKGYTSGLVTVLANYDFTKNPREIYAVKEDEITGV